MAARVIIKGSEAILRDDMTWESDNPLLLTALNGLKDIILPKIPTSNPNPHRELCMQTVSNLHGELIDYVRPQEPATDEGETPIY